MRNPHLPNTQTRRGVGGGGGGRGDISLSLYIEIYIIFVFNDTRGTQGACGQARARADSLPPMVGFRVQGSGSNAVHAGNARNEETGTHVALCRPAAERILVFIQSCCCFLMIRTAR